MSRASTAPSSAAIGDEHPVERVLRQQPLPEAVVLVHVVVEVLVHHGAVVAPGVAAEQLVAAGARERHLHEARGQLGGVEVGVALPHARLLEVPGQARHHALHVAGLEDHLVVLGVEQVGHVLGLVALVEGQLEPGRRAQVEADRERLQLLELARGERGDRARVHAPAEIRADRHVRHELAVDRLVEEAVQLLQVLSGVAGLVGLGEVELHVVPRRADAVAGVHAHHRPGGEQGGAPEQRAVGEQVLEREVLRQRLEVQLGAPGRVREHALDLGGEHERLAEPRPVERLDPEPVARQRETPLVAVPDGQREHPVEALERLFAPGGERVEHDLGVAGRAEREAERLELSAQLLEVVDLAVVVEHVAAVGRDHRLAGRRARVEHGQPAVRQAERAVAVVTLPVRTAVAQRVRHPPQDDG